MIHDKTSRATVPSGMKGIPGSVKGNSEPPQLSAYQGKPNNQTKDKIQSTQININQTAGLVQICIPTYLYNNNNFCKYANVVTVCDEFFMLFIIWIIKGYVKQRERKRQCHKIFDFFSLTKHLLPVLLEVTYEDLDFCQKFA